VTYVVGIACLALFIVAGFVIRQVTHKSFDVVEESSQLLIVILLMAGYLLLCAFIGMCFGLLLSVVATILFDTGGELVGFGAIGGAISGVIVGLKLVDERVE
jgi:hypothetical protein